MKYGLNIKPGGVHDPYLTVLLLSFALGSLLLTIVASLTHDRLRPRLSP